MDSTDTLLSYHVRLVDPKMCDTRGINFHEEQAKQLFHILYILSSLYAHGKIIYVLGNIR